MSVEYPLQFEPLVLPPSLVEGSVPVSVESESVILLLPVEFQDPVVVAHELLDSVPLDLFYRASSPEQGSVSIF